MLVYETCNVVFKSLFLWSKENKQNHATLCGWRIMLHCPSHVLYLTHHIKPFLWGEPWQVHVAWAENIALMWKTQHFWASFKIALKHGILGNTVKKNYWLHYKMNTKTCSAKFPSQVVYNSYSFQSHFLFLHVNKLSFPLHSSTFSLDTSFQTTVKISNNWLRQCVGKAENLQ